MLICGAGMISFSGVFVKLAHVAPSVSAFYRVLIGGVILLIIARLRNNSLRPGWKTLRMILLATAFFSMDLILYHRSILIIGPGLSTILSNFQVFFMAAFAIFVLKEKPTSKFLISIPLAVAGLFLIVGFKWEFMSGTYKSGIIFGLLAGLFYAFYILALRNTQIREERISIFSSLAIISLMTAAAVAVYILLVTHQSLAIPDLQTMGAILGLGIVSQVLGWILITSALPELEVSVTGLILLLQPALAYVWDVLLFSHPVSIVEVSGAVIALVAIYLGSTGRVRTSQKKRVSKSREQEAANS